MRGALDLNQQHFQANRIPLGHGDALKPWKQRGLEPLKLLGQLFQRALAHLLAHYLAGGRDAKHHLPAPPIGKRAQRAAGAILLCSGLFEFQRQGFAGGDQGM